MIDESLIDDDFARLLDAFDLAYKQNELDDFWKHNSVASELKERVERAHDGLRKLETFLVNQTNDETPIAKESNQFGGLLNKPVQLDRFEVIREIGRGGFGIVYLANDPTLHRQVAIKIPRIEMLGTDTLQNRFAREAEIAASLDHLHIVPVFEVGTTIDGIYIVSLYCPGKNLAQWLLEHPRELNCTQIVELMICLTDAMSYCHLRSVLHRDIKPANVLLFPTSCRSLPFLPRLNDFGLAKVLESSMSDTASSLLLGTPMYMSPEQASSQYHAISPATDVYALGAILYELLTGEPPFCGAGIAETLDRIRTKVPDAPRCMNSDIPRDLETLCLKCLAKQPADRYPSAQTLLNDLRAFVDGKPISARRLSKLERLVRWSSLKPRIDEASVVVIVVNLIIMGTMVVSILMSYFQMLPEHASQNRLPVLSCLTFLVVVHVPLLIVGRAIHFKKAWASIIGFVSGMLMTMLSSVFLLGSFGSDQLYWNELPGFRVVYGAVILLTALQTVASAVAWNAITRERRRP